MKTYQATFTGRTLGALGVRYEITDFVNAQNEEQALIKLYDKYEHISRAKFKEVSYKKKVTHISCKRWFQKTWGNTYFSSTVYFDDGSFEKIINFEYGYGDQCLQDTLDKLAELGHIQLPAPYDNGCRSYNTTIFIREVMKATYEINDVNRKKDM